MTAPCVGKPQEFWFPGEHQMHLYERGRAVCRTCPRQVACLEDGMGEPAGMWGGMTPAERDRLQRNRRRAG